MCDVTLIVRRMREDWICACALRYVRISFSAKGSESRGCVGIVEGEWRVGSYSGMGTGCGKVLLMFS